MEAVFILAREESQGVVIQDDGGEFVNEVDDEDDEQ